MTMLGLTLNSLRFRLGGFTATFVNTFLGAVVLMSFSSLFDTAGGVGVSAADESSLTTIAGAVGGWGLVIVAFGVSSTMSLSVRQRQAEFALLKAAGATPSQIGRMIIGEGVAVSIIAALLGIIPAWLIGRAVLGALTSTDQIADSVTYEFGSLALIAGLSTTLLATVGAAAITARRAGRISAPGGAERSRRRQPIDRQGQGSRGRSAARRRHRLRSGDRHRRQGRRLHHAERRRSGVHRLRDRPGAAVAGRPAYTDPAGRPRDTAVHGSRRISGDVHHPRTHQTDRGHHHARHRPDRPGCGSLYIQRIQTTANAADGISVSADDKGVETLNLVIVGMISVFAAIVLINNCVASLLARRQEFGLARKLGATPSQILRAVTFESVFAAACGLTLGTVAAAIGIVGFVYGRTGSWRPDLDAVPYFAIIVTGIALTLTASLLAARRSLAAPMIDAAGPMRA